MAKPEVEKTDVLKITEGTWYQLFDKNGNCIAQHFESGDNCTYEDANGDLGVDDERINFYHPFDVPAPVIPDNQKTVEITVVNRKGMGSHVETVDFVDFVTLRQRVDEICDAVPFSKVIVELSPSWEVSDEEQEEFNKIELGE